MNVEFWQLLLMAVGLMMIVEGAGPFAFPNAWREKMQQLAAMPSASLRVAGLVMIVLGLILFLWVSP
jgi:uncharacterized protein YjeT (DUF2065 family)